MYIYHQYFTHTLTFHFSSNNDIDLIIYFLNTVIYMYRNNLVKALIMYIMVIIMTFWLYLSIIIFNYSEFYFWKCGLIKLLFWEVNTQRIECKVIILLHHNNIKPIKHKLFLIQLQKTIYMNGEVVAPKWASSNIWMHWIKLGNRKMTILT